MIQEIYVIDESKELIEKLKTLFQEEKNYKFYLESSKNMEKVLNSIPTLLIINEEHIQEDVVELCKKIRQNEDNTITPIIVLSPSHEEKHCLDVLRTSVEYYLITPLSDEYLYYLVKNLLRLLYINRRVSPLTGLPGNVQIQTEMKKRLLGRESFAMLYIDLDNFKAYNDTYGFFKGDEIIKFTAKTIIKNVHLCKCKESFVGHIGGDDFVAIITEGDYEKVCQDIIIEFDAQIQQFFSEEDIERGYMEVENRKGIVEQFPLTSISIGVVDVEPGRFENTLEIGEVGAQVKHLSKTKPGSTYVIDRRKN